MCWNKVEIRLNRNTVLYIPRHFTIPYRILYYMLWILQYRIYGFFFFIFFFYRFNKECKIHHIYVLQSYIYIHIRF